MSILFPAAKSMRAQTAAVLEAMPEMVELSKKMRQAQAKGLFEVDFRFATSDMKFRAASFLRNSGYRVTNLDYAYFEITISWEEA